MKTVNFNDLYASQPISPTPSVETLSAPVGNWLTQLGHTLKKWLIADKDIQITPMTRRDGQTWWRVYDPYTEQTQWMTSEEEVRVWLDNTRYR
jgi:hypothetical protein